MPDYWFKQRRFGMGYEPCCWQGGVAILVLVGLIILSAYLNGFFTTPDDEITDAQGIRFVVSVFVIIFLFFWRLQDKVQGKLKFRWGKRDVPTQGRDPDWNVGKDLDENK